MSDMKNANFPIDAEGRTYHIYLKRGEVANRVITVGDLSRAIRIARLPGFVPMFVKQAPRLFTTITGTYNEVPTSIIVALMGIPNIDFVVRELRYVIDGPMAIIRVGSCGSPSPRTRVGDIACPSLYRTVLRIPDAYKETDISKKFLVSQPVASDEGLTKLLHRTAQKMNLSVHDGENISACSFYSSQGRTDKNFDDKNEGFIEHITTQIPNLVSIEMESSHIMDLARIANVPIYAAAAQIIIAQRLSQDFMSNSQKHETETSIGVAALQTLAFFEIPGGKEQENAVWKQFNGQVIGDVSILDQQFTE